jgi:hydroxylysine kinase
MSTSGSQPPALGAELETAVSAVPADQAERIATEQYGLIGRAEWLWGEKDSNYRLSLGDGTTYLLKVLNPAEDPVVTSMHSEALLHVERADPSIPVQRIVRTLDGQPNFRMTADDGTSRNVRVVTFVPGTAQKTAATSRVQRHRIGELMGRMQLALRDFHHAAQHHRITWDMKHAMGMRDLVGVFTEIEHRTRLEAIIDGFESAVAPRQHTLPAQVIHNDFNQENILVGTDDPDAITGIIDFGDMVHAPIVFDVAVGAAYQMGEEDDPVMAMGDFLRGYSTVNKLGAQEIEVLYPAILMRLVMRIAIPEWRSHLFPQDRERLTRNSPTVWRQLERLDRYATNDVLQQLAAACQ